jgi:NADH:ubiquinone oxidoreductase subunit F (NADH-binding)/NADH:ubiquinone oxidoreductase subunit E/NAD-dependent dihydropyrimidine dehydrogenase PreA subunit
VSGARLVQEAIERTLRIPEGEDTDPERRFTVEKVACLGSCTLAPVVQLGDVVTGHLTPVLAPRFLEEAAARAERAPVARRSRVVSDGSSRGEIRIALESCCLANGCGEVFDAAVEAAGRAGGSIDVKPTGCVGACSQTPLVEIARPGQETVSYARVRPEDVEAIVWRHFPPRGVAGRLRAFASGLLQTLLPEEAAPEPSEGDAETLAGFRARQRHVASEHIGRLEPLDLDEYREHGGLVALARALEEGPEWVLAEVTASGLRGRGGAGFPTGTKWRRVLEAPGERKWIVCNGDEGDPGAFMDRMLLESFPFRVLEGMVVAAYAVGASQGVLYVRDEYPAAVRAVRRALDLCQERGVLGREGVLGGEFHLELTVIEGAGAFVCGEETALIASLEGRRGIPRLRPPYPAQTGLWGEPTLVNNVETLAVVPWILRNGAASFADLGTPESPGTKVFSLAGKVPRAGLIEVPMGITIREIVEEIGGLSPDADSRPAFKAVLVGGPSGGCVPAALADTPVDYEALQEVGAIMGSGGLVVLDHSDCVVDVARYFLRFTQEQSCGRCTFCRIGTRRLCEILDRLCAGEGRPGDLERIETLSRQIQQSSLCGLGTTAPNPVLSSLRHFREEYEAHLEGRCPAGACAPLVSYSITETCIGCTVCAQYCPAGAIPMRPYLQHSVNDGACTRCGTCARVCPSDAVKVG